MSVTDGGPTDSMFEHFTTKGTQLMPIYIPYFYIIQEVSTGKFYAGSKYGQGANPAKFMTEDGYTTSSKIVNEIIRKSGLKSFIVRKIKVFDTAESAYNHETKFLEKVDARNNPKFYNCHNNDGLALYNPEVRKIADNDGKTSYEKGAIKGAETKMKDIVDGKNCFQRAYEKALKNNPDLISIRSRNMAKTMSKIDEKTGLNLYQKSGMKRRGNKNPSCKPENAKKISEGRKRYIKKNEKVWLERQNKLNKKLDNEKDENGMTARERHSEWMKKNNPTTGSKWYNNGHKNIRIKPDQKIPEGYFPGRANV